RPRDASVPAPQVCIAMRAVDLVASNVTTAGRTSQEMFGTCHRPIIRPSDEDRQGNSGVARVKLKKRRPACGGQPLDAPARASLEIPVGCLFDAACRNRTVIVQVRSPPGGPST